MQTVLLLAAWSLAEPPVQPAIVVKPEAFETLINPNCSHCIDEAKRRAKDLRDGDRVLCWIRGKYEGGVIPVRFFLAPYRVISDTYGTFVFDPDAGFARAFPASLDYRFHGWHRGIMVMKHKDGTLFSTLSGRAFDGPRRGQKLPYWPTIMADWGWYAKHYPGGVAYHMYEEYKPMEPPQGPNQESVKTRIKADPRLPEDEIVLGIDREGTRSSSVAIPLKDIAKLGSFGVMPHTFECGNKAIILWQSSTRTAVAYSPVAQKHQPTTELGIEGKVLESKTELKIEADGKSNAAPFVDRVTGTRFDICGRGVEGELKGWTLSALPSITCKWFAWAAEFPLTGVLEKKNGK